MNSHVLRSAPPTTFFRPTFAFRVALYSANLFSHHNIVVAREPLPPLPRSLSGCTMAVVVPNLGLSPSAASFYCPYGSDGFHRFPYRYREDECHQEKVKHVWRRPSNLNRVWHAPNSVWRLSEDGRVHYGDGRHAKPLHALEALSFVSIVAAVQTVLFSLVLYIHVLSSNT
ncbi:hypothetical protein QR680_006409 [Steinernema hermaphroditum]|uniref:Uncharacterized protein n=1 Tax=Steinernema hermaphroditum TaxID=289476 RepID=A0AA39LWH8_9BILA|nr:hypothetical protein QR680_006409 [Steinernema hermaphroditum]